jgi:inorganic phosphate transporter, PiT family
VIDFDSSSQAAERVFAAHAAPAPAITVPAARAEVTHYIAMRQFTPATMGALTVLSGDIDHQVASYGSLTKVPAAMTRNIRNDMYLTGSALKRLGKEKAVTLNPAETKALDVYKKDLEKATQFIPTWVKVAVAIALGLGTMIGWKRIVVTVGEKIGKSHLTYAQGAVAELVTMATISAADNFGLPVSTTHVLSSGVAGAMAGNGSGLQMGTLRNLAIAWVLTLPASILISGLLYLGLSQVI